MTHLCDVACLICSKLGLASVPATGVHRTTAPVPMTLPAGWQNAGRPPVFIPVCSERCLDTWRRALTCSL